MESWLIRFDKDGACTSPKTRDALLTRIADRQQPIIFFSHGWNNDFADAVDLYRRFLSDFERVIAAHPIGHGPAIFVGVSWPSIWLPSEPGPQMAAASDLQMLTNEAVLQEVAGLLPSTADRARLYELLEVNKIDLTEARELARLVKPIIIPDQPEGVKEAQANEDNILAAIKDIQLASEGEASTDDDIDAIGTVDGSGRGRIRAAGGLEYLDPRNAIRMASLYIMKDRAGKVGANGIATLLREMLTGCPAPIHGVGHSFGCKVMLSALVAGSRPTRRMKSLLLLQPAISYLSFATHIPGRDAPGGYRDAFDLVETPIFSTYSAADIPLHAIYHLALLRQKDLGELQIAAPPTTAGSPPSVYAALGGYGPRDAAEQLVDPIPLPGEHVDYPNAPIVGFDGSAGNRIDAHGGIANPSTAWLLREQMSR
ncbi:hypothetical protein [Bradyrhizobium sp. NC92]|uniref:hypothetical protein n=1 Tax=Bradyrhizobium sp. (strain NC92) TaxID=55395 RepID=UPI0021AA5D14|nr:hypothetical protein [Bradyrhizobium sp. NC92]UWU68049.1 hypothetical protein N2602_33770 [Bradyrhizobium sp. NC92]